MTSICTYRRLIAITGSVLMGLVCVVGYMPSPAFANDTLATTINLGHWTIGAYALGTKVYVGGYGNATVYAIDTSTDTIVSTISVGTNPYALVAVGTKLYVGNQGAGTVSVIDTTNDTVIKTITVGSSPADEFVLNNKVYVANNSGGSVSVIDTSTDTVTATISVGSSPSGGNLGSLSAVNSKLFVPNLASSSVSVIDTNTNTVVDTIPVGHSPTITHALGTKVYVSNYGDGTVSVIDATTDTVSKTITVGRQPYGMITLGTNIYEGNVQDLNLSVIDSTTDTVLTTIGLGGSLGYGSTGLAVLGGKIYVGDENNPRVFVVDTANANATTSVALAGSEAANLAVVGSRLYATDDATGNGIAVIQTDYVAPQQSSHGGIPRTLAVPAAPSVQTSLAGNDLKASVNYVSGNTIIDELGIVYDVNGTEKVVPVLQNVGDVTSFTYTLSDLSCGSTYLVSAYAKNSLATVHSATTTVSTLACPTVAASSVPSVSPASATVSTVPESKLAQSSSTPHNLTIGATGLDVQLLQKFLNRAGFPIAVVGPGAPGQETTLFGLFTKAALTKYQKANGIVPATGYFGPLTRAYMKNKEASNTWW